MGGWLTYTRERFPLPTYFLLAGGFSLSGLFVSSGTFVWGGFLASFSGLLVFLYLLRLMDEVKDYDKDIVAHPDRPLPRGVLTLGAVRRAILILLLAMGGYSLLLAYLLNVTAGALYLGAVVYLWLMYKEFFLGAWLEQRPFLYACTHQPVILPVCMFAVATARPELAFSRPSLFLALAILGAFFCYEVCRKLDPAAHPILRTYLAVYGAPKTALMAAFLSCMAACGAWGLALGKALWPVEALLALSLGLLFASPGRYKIIEGLATLSLLIHLWVTVVQHVTGWPH